MDNLTSRATTAASGRARILMTASATLGLVLPAALFALVYFPTFNYLSVGLVSPYAKVDPRKRFLAAFLDSLPVVSAWFLYRNSGALLFLVAGGGYLLLRDSMGGQSLGKFLVGLVVISIETGRPCTWKGSALRNGLLLIPGANLAAIFLEAFTVIRDPQGQRLGDRVAQSQVVEGLGARDLAASLQRWLRDFLAGLNPVVRKPSRQPAER